MHTTELHPPTHGIEDKAQDIEYQRRARAALNTVVEGPRATR